MDMMDSLFKWKTKPPGKDSTSAEHCLDRKAPARSGGLARSNQ